MVRPQMSPNPAVEPVDTHVPDIGIKDYAMDVKGFKGAQGIQGAWDSHEVPMSPRHS